MKVIFLHIPKTAGSSVIAGLKSAFGGSKISPIRSHTQTDGSCFRDWSKYDVFAGHIDWYDLGDQNGPKFAFSILRPPKERIASFYFFLLSEAEKLTPKQLRRPENTGKHAILTMDVDDYFSGGSQKWQTFVRDHYDNFYCTYLARKKFRPGPAFRALPYKDRLNQALDGLSEIDFVCTTDNLTELERRIHGATGKSVNLATRRENAGPLPQTQSRWAALCGRVGSDKTIARLEAFTEFDAQIFETVERNS